MSTYIEERNKSENVYKSYKIFSTNIHIYFTEIAKVFKQPIMHCINKSLYSVGSSLTLIISLTQIHTYHMLRNFLLNISVFAVNTMQTILYKIFLK